MKYNAIILMISLSFLTVSCEKDFTGNSSCDNADSFRYVFNVKGKESGTRTHISGGKFLTTSFEWDRGDCIGLIIEDIQYNKLFKCTDVAQGTFDGYLSVTGKKKSSVEYVAYYPYTASTAGGGDLMGVLPKIQTAPFDSSADYMLSDVVKVGYDEQNMPQLNLNFNTHLFSIVRFSFVNTDSALASEVISEIRFKATNKVLSGRFVFDATDKSSDPSFSEVPGECSNGVILKYPDSSHVLGNGVEHTVYAVMKPCDIPAGDFRISVITENTASRFVSTNSLSLSKNEVTALPLMNLSDSDQTVGKRTIVLWGDSITNDVFCSTVQKELGPQWNVIPGGVPGDTMYGIASRQGSLSLRNTNAFVIPGDQSVVTMGTVYCGENKALFFAHPNYGSAKGALINTVMINGVEGNMEYDIDNKIWKFSRSSPGASVSVPAGTYIQTFASRKYKDVDLISIYMGANGAPKYDSLLGMHQTMRDYTTRKEVIVLGYSMDKSIFGGTTRYWSEEYVKLFTDAFGRRFVDQRTEGSANAHRLLVELGELGYGELMSSEDQAAVVAGDWPESFFTSSSDNVHPNSTGNKVMAILLRERMEELGYLD